MGAKVFAVDGTEDHVHMVVSLPPSLAVSDFIGNVKGYSSHEVNQARLAVSHFKWQQEYGAFSFDIKRLPHLIAYVENQKRHHAKKSTIRILERTIDSNSEVREPATYYDLDDTQWRRDLESLAEP